MYARLFSFSLAILGAVYFYLSSRLPLQTLNGPGAGFFPLAVSGGLVLTGIASGLQGNRLSDADAIDGSATRRVLVVFISLVAFCYLLPRLGYALSGLAVMISVLRQLNAGWRMTLAVATTSIICTYFLFAYVLGLPLPRGSLWGG